MINVHTNNLSINLVNYNNSMASLLGTNGDSFEGIKPQRDLRRGDSLSFYFFLICAEGLQGLIK